MPFLNTERIIFSTLRCSNLRMKKKMYNNSHLTKSHEAWLVPNRGHLIADHVSNRQPNRGAISWQYTTSTNNFIHPSTSPLFRWTRIRIKVKVCYRTSSGVINPVKPNISIPDLVISNIITKLNYLPCWKFTCKKEGWKSKKQIYHRS